MDFSNRPRSPQQHGAVIALFAQCGPFQSKVERARVHRATCLRSGHSVRGQECRPLRKYLRATIHYPDLQRKLPQRLLRAAVPGVRPSTSRLPRATWRFPARAVRCSYASNTLVVKNHDAISLLREPAALDAPAGYVVPDFGLL